MSNGRNQFENNEPEGVTQEEALALGDKVHSLLPPLADGQRYELTKLTNGRTAVTVENEENAHDIQIKNLYGALPPTDRFGRKFTR